MNRHLRQVLLTYLIVIALVPLVALGGRWVLVLPVLLVVAAWGARAAAKLRRSSAQR